MFRHSSGHGVPEECNKIKLVVDKMLVVFPFEEKLYNDNDVDVSFVGHPLIERINDYEFFKS